MNVEYKNPIARNGDFADPFVLRYNGSYYLYATNEDIRCFRSENLVDWKLEGAVITPDTFPDLVPFAPEVVSYNGKFYMYTSPSGIGHYVLESAHPTGPFRKITGNVGHDIDGSVFIDDDGRWYFYWASQEGILGCEMVSPTEFGEAVHTGAYLHGWTEGPFVYKRDDIYYLTYTGNHYLSKGYRIQTAWSRHPLKGYQDDFYNPAIVHTQGIGVGLGHSSTVLGPDLVSYYLVYHNLNEDASRDLNIDRILWHKEATQILGPTRTAQSAPKLPDVSFPIMTGGKELRWKFEKGFWKKKEDIYYCENGGFQIKSKERFGANFTAELHILIPSGNEACGIFLESETGEIFSIEFAATENKMFLYEYESRAGEYKILCQAAMRNFNVYDILHEIGIEVYHGKMTIFLERRKILEARIRSGLHQIGYFSDEKVIGIGYTAVTNTVYEEAKERVEMPTGCSFMPICGSGDTLFDEKGRVILAIGQTREYQVRVPEAGNYQLYITVKNPENSRICVAHNGNDAMEYACDLGLLKAEVQFEKGLQLLALKGLSGKTILERLEVIRQDTTRFVKEKKGIAVGPYGKVILDPMSDDALEVEFLVREFGKDGSAGVLIRLTEPAEGGEGGDPVLGIDFFKGYSVSVTGSLLRIAKHCYNRTVLGEAEFEVEKNQTYHFFITVRGCCITVHDCAWNQLLRVLDERILVSGQVGIWAENSRMELLKLKASC